MKLSLKEARKRATPGKLTTALGVLIAEDETRLPLSNPKKPVTTDLECANAAMLAHAWNRFDEVVVALENLAFDAGRVERKFSEGRDWTEWRDLRDKLASAKRLLARAKTVEMP